MSNDIKIVEDENAAQEDINFVGNQLAAFNTARTNRRPRKPLHLFAFDSGQQIVGGLLGEIGWGWLYISVLWVHEDYRGKGLGIRLLKQAEAESLKLNINRAFLDTNSIEARMFYEKMGYEVFGQLEDYPPGYTFYYMRKMDF